MKIFFLFTTVLFVSFTARAIEVNDAVSAEAFAACDTGDAANDYLCFVQYVSVASWRSCNGKGRWRIPEHDVYTEA